MGRNGKRIGTKRSRMTHTVERTVSKRGVREWRRIKCILLVCGGARRGEGFSRIVCLFPVAIIS